MFYYTFFITIGLRLLIEILITPRYKDLLSKAIVLSNPGLELGWMRIILSTRLLDLLRLLLGLIIINL